MWVIQNSALVSTEQSGQAQSAFVLYHTTIQYNIIASFIKKEQRTDDSGVIRLSRNTLSLVNVSYWACVHYVTDDSSCSFLMSLPHPTVKYKNNPTMGLPRSTGISTSSLYHNTHD